MSEPQIPDLAGLSLEQKHNLLKRLMKRRRGGESTEKAIPSNSKSDYPPAYYHFDDFPEYKQLLLTRTVGDQMGIQSPFFKVHEGVARDTTRIDGRELINFSNYSYVGLNGDPRVSDAAAEAAQRYGTSASASRLVSGERPPHRELERNLADFLGTEDCLTFVSGHSTNVSTLSALFGSKDLIVHDRLIHHSILQGALASGAQRLVFPHNDMEALEKLLSERRRNFEKVLIVVEGIYSMDGDMAPLPELVVIKNRHKAILMVDEAHSIGVAGKTGRGVTEHFGVPASGVDILMGTLSKSFAGCGGFIGGSHALIELLKFTASGFVYSVGMPPPMAAAAHASLDILRAEPDRVRKLQQNGQYFLGFARALHLDTGYSQGFNIVPVIIGSSIAASRISNALFREGINVQPIIHPAVEEKAARLRFFLSCQHSVAQLEEGARATFEQIVMMNI